MALRSRHRDQQTRRVAVTQSAIYVHHQSSYDTGHTKCNLRTPPNSLLMTPVTQSAIYVHHQKSFCDTGHTKWPADAVCSCHTKCHLRAPPNSLPATPVTQTVFYLHSLPMTPVTQFSVSLSRQGLSARVPTFLPSLPCGTRVIVGLILGCHGATVLHCLHDKRRPLSLRARY